MRAYVACFLTVVAAGMVRSSSLKLVKSYDKETLTTAPRTYVPTGVPTPNSTTAIPDITCSGDAIGITFSDRLYVDHTSGGSGACVTLTDIYNSRLSEEGSSMGPLYVLDSDNNVLNGARQEITGRWILTSDLYIQDGVTLLLWGIGWGGDADVLRLESTPSTFLNLRGYGGHLSFFHIVVTSWDIGIGLPREFYESGRSYISCVSEVVLDDTCEGKAKKDMGECRMDVISSEIGYLGWPDAESYGLTWKVRGLCDDLSNLDVFDRVNVYGDMMDSDIHHNYYGMYTYGHEGGFWVNNSMHDNIQYGFDPHDDSDNLVIAFNTVYDNGNHGIIASKRCNNVTIHDNEIYGGQRGGIFLHRSSDNSKVYHNHVHDNAESGMTLHESTGCEVFNNLFERNDLGIRVTVGASGNAIHHNEFDNSTRWGIVSYEGSDPGWVTDGRPSDNIFHENVISNTAVGIRFNDGDNNKLYDNVFTGTEIVRFYGSEDTELKNNVFPPQTCTWVIDSTFTSDSELPPPC